MTNPIVYAALLLNQLGQAVGEENLTATLIAAGADSEKYNAQVKEFVRQIHSIDFKTEVEKARIIPKIPELPTESAIATPRKEEPASDADSFGFDKLFGN